MRENVKFILTAARCNVIRQNSCNETHRVRQWRPAIQQLLEYPSLLYRRAILRVQRVYKRYEMAFVKVIMNVYCNEAIKTFR